MTGQEIIDRFETFVEDSLDQDAALLLMNNAKNDIESEREWEMLKKLDSSSSATSSAITLPTDFNRPIDGTIYVGTQPYVQIPFEQQRLQSQAALRWYLDLRNNCYYLLGPSLSGTVYFPYIYQTNDLTISTSPVWPSRFHPLLAFKMAELFYSIDQGERGRSWDDKWAIQYRILKNSMIDWDVKLQRQSLEYATPLDVGLDIPLSSF